eukprot:SAG11_NODE_9529_length_903_cov_0.893035_2_plen_77_part_00
MSRWELLLVRILASTTVLVLRSNYNSIGSRYSPLLNLDHSIPGTRVLNSVDDKYLGTCMYFEKSTTVPEVQCADLL